MCKHASLGSVRLSERGVSCVTCRSASHAYGKNHSSGMAPSMALERLVEAWPLETPLRRLDEPPSVLSTLLPAGSFPPLAMDSVTEGAPAEARDRVSVAQAFGPAPNKEPRLPFLAGLSAAAAGCSDAPATKIEGRCDLPMKPTMEGRLALPPAVDLLLSLLLLPRFPSTDDSLDVPEARQLARLARARVAASSSSMRSCSRSIISTCLRRPMRSRCHRGAKGGCGKRGGFGARELGGSGGG